MPERGIPLTRPWMDDRELEATGRVIRSGWVTQGPEVAAFENEFAVLVGAEYACAVSSCTTALHLALRACRVDAGDEVIVPSYSYIATANAVRYCGATPVFVDIEDDSPNIDPALVEESIGRGTKAILCVHQVGIPARIEDLRDIALRHGLPLIEDAACAIGSEVMNASGSWTSIGAPHGDIACFSFHPRKLLTTGDGGMLTCRDPVLDQRFRRERQHGMDIPDRQRHESNRVIDESHTSLGYNYRLTDLQAAIGRVQLTRLPEILARRRALASRYLDLLTRLPVALPKVPAWARTNWQSFSVGLPDYCDRASVMQMMLDSGISTRRGVHCAHKEPAYSHEPWRTGAGGLGNSEKAQDCSLVLPLFHEMTEDEQDRVVDCLEAALVNGMSKSRSQ